MTMNARKNTDSNPANSNANNNINNYENANNHDNNGVKDISSNNNCSDNNLRNTNINNLNNRKARRERNSAKSKQDILRAAEIRFAEKGIYGTRVDDIAMTANINKRMLYEYFGNKEELYKAVLAEVYSRLSKQEMVLLSENMSCIDSMKKIIELYFTFLKNNPTYVNLIIWENLNKGNYIKDIDFSKIKAPVFNLLRKVIDKGKSDGIFRTDVDTEEVILSLLTHTFSYFSNRYTLSKLLGREIDTEENIKKRTDTVTEMFLRYLCVDGEEIHGEKA